MPLHPMRYAELLGQKQARHQAGCWLVNTGWSGGPYGVGSRMSIEVSRAVVAAILGDGLVEARFRTDPTFGFQIPDSCPGVSSRVLSPRDTWPDPAGYDAKARELAELFKKNFEAYAAACSAEVRAAGPR
jgi:phosphoenolpyruvate carboxykinase (ATP)